MLTHSLTDHSKAAHLTTKHPRLSTAEPTTTTQALRHPHWKQAMIDEYEAVLHNGTWELVPYTSSQNIVGYKWPFRTK